MSKSNTFPLRAKQRGVEKPFDRGSGQFCGAKFSTPPRSARTIRGCVAYLSSQKGQGLIEVLAALTIAMVVLTALSVAAVTSVRNATFAKNQNQANAYARQTMDGIRAYRDLYKTHFFNVKSEGCYILSNNIVQDLAADGITPLSDPLTQVIGSLPCKDAATVGDTSLGSGFVRKIMLDKDGNFTPPTKCPAPINANSCVNVVVYVQWTDASGDHSSELSSIFGKWQ